jgi:hypothetical protein
MTGLLIHTTLGDRHVPFGTSRTVGRDADIALLSVGGRSVSWLHAEAFTISAEPDHWTISIMEGKRYEVGVTDDDSGACRTVAVGTATRFRWRLATIILNAGGVEHRLRVNASGLGRIAHPPGTTMDPEFILDPEDLHDRVWIAACQHRVARPGAPAVPWPVVGQMLSGAGRWEDLDITDAAVRQRAQWRRPHIEGHMEMSGMLAPFSADRMVDFLVRTGSVTCVEVGAVVDQVTA